MLIAASDQSQSNPTPYVVILGLLVLLLLGFGMQWVVGRRGAFASIVLAVAIAAVGLLLWRTTGLASHSIRKSTFGVMFLLVAAVSGVAVYVSVSGIQELLRMRGADGKSGPHH